jgi:hypothetical protein
MKPLMRSLLAFAGAVLLFCCSGNPGTANGGRTLNVNGKVMSQNGGVSANVPVVIKSGATFSVSTRTDSNGNFALANVPTPYDAVVLNGNLVTVSVGLTSATPIVLDMFSSTTPVTGPGGYASLSGTVSGGGGFPMAGLSRTSVLFASPEVQTNQYLFANPETGAYSTNDAYQDDNGDPAPLRWAGPTTTTGTLHVLQALMRPSPYEPTSYSGYGFKENVSLADGSAVTEDIALTAVTPATFAGTYGTPPAGYTLVQGLVALKFPSGGLMVIEADPVPSTTFSYNTPNIPGATLVLAALAVKDDAYSLVVDTGLAVNASGVTVDFPAAEELSARSILFTTGAQFPLTAVPNAVNLVVMDSHSTVPSYIFLTSATSVTIPDLTSAGLKLPANTDYSWVVYGFGPYADVEAASAGLRGEHQWGYLNSINDPVYINLVNSSTGGFVTASPTVHLTTAP